MPTDTSPSSTATTLHRRITLIISPVFLARIDAATEIERARRHGATVPRADIVHQRQGGRRSRAVVDMRRHPTPHQVIADRLNGRVEEPVEGFVDEPLPMTAALRRLLGRLASA
jgi:hypothetical protein